MNIGLFFGSFNPVHVGHLIIASHMANYTNLDKVWLMVSPHNPLKAKNALINMYDRLEMTRLAVEDSLNITVSDAEFKLPQPSYTIDTLTHLKERYPEAVFEAFEINTKRAKRAVVVRPDLHIGYVNDIVDIELIDGYLKQVIGWRTA